jgi:hypothetical protein
VSLSTIDEGQPEITVSELRGKETFDRTQAGAIELNIPHFLSSIRGTSSSVRRRGREAKTRGRSA